MADSRHRLVLCTAYDFLANRGLAITLHWHRAIHRQIATELQLTPEERAEAIEIANDMEGYLLFPAHYLTTRAHRALADTQHQTTP